MPQLPHLPRLPGMPHLPHLPPLPPPAALARMLVRRERRRWRGDGRVHLELRTGDGGEAERLAKELVGALDEIEGVAWWELHVPTRRLVVALDAPTAGDGATLAAIEAALAHAEDAIGVRAPPVR
jgi:hypothetical protein